MKKRFIKLINNERNHAKVSPMKGCISNSYDVCTIIDAAHCSSYAYDKCGKDYRACSEGADDVCAYIDNAACSGAGADDTCSYNDTTACNGFGAEDIT